MICSKCSAQLNDNDKFCTACGQLNTAPVQPVINPATTTAPISTAPVIDPVFTNTSVATPAQTIQSAPTMPAAPTASTYSYPTTSPTKSSKLPLVIAGVLGLVLIIAAIIVIPGMLSKSEKPEEVAKVVVTGVKVKVDDFTLTIPEEYIFDATSSSLTIFNSDETWASKILIESASYNQVVSNKSKLKASILKSGYEASDPIEKTIDGSSVLSVEITTDSHKSLLAFKSGSSTKVFCIEIITEDDTFDYEVLKKLVTILNTAVYEVETASTKMSTPTLDVESLLTESLK